MPKKNVIKNSNKNTDTGMQLIQFRASDSTEKKTCKMSWDKTDMEWLWLHKRSMIVLGEH